MFLKSNSDLPCEIIFEILKKLPAKVLMSFKCVSKAWLKMILDPSFQEAHQNDALRRADASHRVFACLKTNFLVLYDCSNPRHVVLLSSNKMKLYVISSSPFPDVFFPSSLPLCRDFKTMSNIANGHIVIYIYDPMDHVQTPSLYLINLATIRIISLPIPKHISVFMSTFFLGFDPSSNNFKVVYFNGNASDKCSILTVGSLSWRDLPYSCADFKVRDADCICIKGKLFYKKGDKVLQAVTFFDLKDETFHQQPVPLASLHREGPTGWFDHPYFYQEIFDMKGKLGLLREQKVWILEQTGWCEKDIILPEEVLNGRYAGQEFNGKIVIKSTQAADEPSKYYIYDLETCECKEAPSISLQEWNFRSYLFDLQIPHFVPKLLNYVESIIDV